MPALKRATADKQDELETQEKSKKIYLQQRPRMKFSLFTGLPEQVDIFLKNAKTIFQLYPTAEQRILQIAELVNDDIKTTHTALFFYRQQRP